MTEEMFLSLTRGGGGQRTENVFPSYMYVTSCSYLCTVVSDDHNQNNIFSQDQNIVLRKKLR